MELNGQKVRLKAPRQIIRAYLRTPLGTHHFLTNPRPLRLGSSAALMNLAVAFMT